MAHPLTVGTVLYSSWGYDQTNIDFYEVVKATAKTVTIRGIKQVRTHDGYMQGSCVPATGDDRWFPAGDVLGRDKPMVRTVRISPYDNLPRVNAHADYASAQPWRGNSIGWSSYA